MKRTARLSIRTHPEALMMLRGLARFSKTTVAQLVRDALGAWYNEQMGYIATAMRVQGYTETQRKRVLRAITKNESLPRLRAPKK